MLSVNEILPVLVSPEGRKSLQHDAGSLVTLDGAHSYRIDQYGIPQFAETQNTEEVARQQTHYNNIAQVYVANLGYPHTKEYLAYLDRCLFDVMGTECLGDMAELCCGHGEAIELLKGQYRRAFGVDISPAMLRVAADRHRDKPCALLQADVTRLPLADACVDAVVMLGGIHHVPDRVGLYSEVFRILRPGGRFIWREPVNDFLVWRWLRAIVYRVSPTLDHLTEAPLRFGDTRADLSRAGLKLADWRPAGFIGFCLFMNSDVMVFNRLFRFVPGIRAITRAFARADDWVVRLRQLRSLGLVVVGQAVRPAG